MPVTRRRALDAAGLALTASLAAWALVAAVGHPGSRPLPFIGAVLLAVGAFGAGRAAAERNAAAPAATVLILAGIGAVEGIGHLRDAGGGPLGYANANASLFGLAALAALSVLVTVKGRSVVASPIMLTIAAVFAALTVVTGSLAGMAVLVFGVVTAVVGRRLAGAVALGAIMVAIGLTSVIGVGTPHRGTDGFAVRTQLWHEAERLLHTEPVRGIGPARFARLTTVSRDADLRWAHNEYLQTAAELGAVGLMLVVLLIGWAAIRLLIAASFHQPLAAWGAAALACTGLHASVDYVLHFPIVVTLTALLIGAGAAERPPRCS